MHKIQSLNDIPPLRPIVTSVDIYDYQLAKYLCNLLQPHLPTTYTLSDSFSFVKELRTIDISNKPVVYFDVVSLFINSSFKESIDPAVSYFTKGSTSFKLSKADLAKLFPIATSQTHFTCHGEVYGQIDDIPPGSHLC